MNVFKASATSQLEMHAWKWSPAPFSKPTTHVPTAVQTVALPLAHVLPLATCTCTCHVTTGKSSAVRVLTTVESWSDRGGIRLTLLLAAVSFRASRAHSSTLTTPNSAALARVACCSPTTSAATPIAIHAHATRLSSMARPALVRVIVRSGSSSRAAAGCCRTIGCASRRRSLAGDVAGEADRGLERRGRLSLTGEARVGAGEISRRGRRRCCATTTSAEGSCRFVNGTGSTGLRLLSRLRSGVPWRGAPGLGEVSRDRGRERGRGLSSIGWTSSVSMSLRYVSCLASAGITMDGSERARTPKSTPRCGWDVSLRDLRAEVNGKKIEPGLSAITNETYRGYVVLFVLPCQTTDRCSKQRWKP